MKVTIGIWVMVCLLSACVTQKKYNELLSEKVQLEGDLNTSEEGLKKSEESVAELTSDLESMKETNSILSDSLRENILKATELKGEFEELNRYYNNLLKNSGELTKDLSEQQNELGKMRENLENSQKMNDLLAADLNEREAKVQELEDILARKDEAVSSLKSRISNALLNFKESDLTVEVKNGKVYVSLAEQLLFKSGSIEVDPKGQAALKQLGAALKGQKDIHVMVEGHTDNVPISRSSLYMKDNWDLSVMRATSIVKILTNNGVAPEQVSAAGKGEFSPVDNNESAEGRQKNRRTEIIITPDLDELFRLLEGN